jgi:mannan endo-1,6-alpha-mannosidase
MLAFKGFLLRSMASTAQLAPFTRDVIMPLLKSSAEAAAKSCDGAVCGFRWTTGAYDDTKGVGQQLNALAALSSLLIDEAPVKAGNGTAPGGGATGTTPGGQQQTNKPNAGSRPAVGSLVGFSAISVVLGAFLL